MEAKKCPSSIAAALAQLLDVIHGYYLVLFSHVVQIVSLILHDAALKALWLSELEQLRQRIQHS